MAHHGGKQALPARHTAYTGSHAGSPALIGDAPALPDADDTPLSILCRHAAAAHPQNFAAMESGSASLDDDPPTPPGTAVPDGTRQMLHSVSGGPSKTSRADSAQPPAVGAPVQQNLMIVSNRLPVSVSRDPQTGEWALPMSPGGLVSALLGVSQVRINLGAAL